VWVALAILTVDAVRALRERGESSPEPATEIPGAKPLLVGQPAR